MKRKKGGRSTYSIETDSTANNAHLLRDEVHATLALLLLQLQGDAANRAALDALHQVLLMRRTRKIETVRTENSVSRRLKQRIHCQQTEK